MVMLRGLAVDGYRPAGGRGAVRSGALLAEANRPQGRDFRLQTSGFRLQASDFRLQASGFGLQTSDFRLQTSESLMLGRTCSLKRTGLTGLNCGARIPLFRGFGFPVSGSKFRFPPVAFSQVPSSGFQVPGSAFPRFRVPGSRFRFFFFPATGYRLLATVYQERTCDT